jgi:hypothetical protein
MLRQSRFDPPLIIPARRARRAPARCCDLPAFAAAQDPRLVRISEPLDIPKMPIWLLTHPEVRGNARVRALLQHLAERTPAVLDSLTRAGACCEATLRALAAVNAGAPAKRARSGKRRD